MTTTLLNKVMTLELAKKLGQLLGSEHLNEQENYEAHKILRNYAASMNQVLHISDNGGVYLATSHVLRESTDTTRLN